ncbi:MAG TPA: hypothetical protein VGR31_11880 [Planctomycetota bacterium]|jgi:hypothetical protein|nr:hypothetical protein [Planctomycetota bacterium]
MAETPWTEEAAVGPPKKKVPTWVWFCGGGCLLAVLVAIAAIAILVPMLKNAMNPEVQWEHLARVLPYDARPPELTPTMGLNFGESMDQVQLQDTRGFMITVQSLAGKSGAEQRRKLFASEKPEFPENAGVVKFADLQSGTVDVQGRSLRILRMRMEFPAFIKMLMSKKAQSELGKLSSIAFVDVTAEGADGLVYLEMMKVTGSDPVSDEEVQTFLKPFRIGPKHGAEH